MKRSGLPVFVRVDGRPVILVGEGAQADAKRALLERAGAVVVGEGDAAPLALIACDDPEPVAARLRARGVLVNVADRPDLCDFTLPAIVDRDPVVVAIGTGGASAGLAAAIRQRLETLLPASLGRLADALSVARRSHDAPARRRALAAIDPLSDDAVSHLGIAFRETTERRSEIRAFTLDILTSDDLTLRQARLLGQADQVTYRPGVPPEILARARADALKIACDSPPQGLPGLTVDLSMAS
jgi:uroporphyrin-III C-methyltransferase/precorrin-2 dehydrogenase/sirohydrochlorin ferrochelatase